MDVLISLLCTPAPTDIEIEEARRSVKNLKVLWLKIGLSQTPKAHILFDHAVDQFEKFGGKIPPSWQTVT